MYEAMARRYRPTAFEEVIGQEHVAQTLRNAIAGDRVAHAYLFCGPHGCGKTSMARVFAKALVIGEGTPTEPEQAELARDILRGRDVDVQEIDGASNNGVEQVRQLREQAGYVPVRAKYKIYIIDEVHMLSVAAFNALLKTLEEPPPHVKFILATTDPHRLPDTVLSRCQRFDFRLVPPPVLGKFLKSLVAQENAQIEDDAVEAVAAFSGGSVRDGLVLLDQLLSFAQGAVTRADVERVRGVAGAESVAGLIESVWRRDLPGALKTVDAVAQMGTNVGDFLDQLIDFCRDLMLMIGTGSGEGIAAYGPARASLERLAQELSLEQVLLYLDTLVEARIRLQSRALSNPLVPLEMAVAYLAGVEDLKPVSTLMQQLDAVARGAPLPQAPAPAAPAAYPGAAATAPSPAPERPTAPAAAAATPAPALAMQPEAVPVATAVAAPAEEPKEAVTQAPVEERSPSTASAPYEEETEAKAEAETRRATSKEETTHQEEADDSPPWDDATPEAPTTTRTEPAPSVSVAPASESGPNTSAPALAPTPAAWPGAADASAPALTLKQVQAAWPAVLEFLTTAESPVLPYVRQAVTVHDVQGNRIVLGVPGRFHMERLDDARHRERLADALQRVLGANVTVGLHLVASAAASRDDAPQPRRDVQERNHVLHDEGVRLVLDMFDGQVMSVDESLPAAAGDVTVPPEDEEQDESE